MALRVLILLAGWAAEDAAAAGAEAVGTGAEGGVVLSLDGTVVAAVSILIAELLTLTSEAEVVLTSVAVLTSGLTSGVGEALRLLVAFESADTSGLPEVVLLTCVALAFLVLTFLAAELVADEGVGGTVCRVGVCSRRVEGGLAGVEGVGVC